MELHHSKWTLKSPVLHLNNGASFKSSKRGKFTSWEMNKALSASRADVETYAKNGKNNC